MYVIGTAGHVDHGKSVLVEALTGIDPDRLLEEKERGMTIDLGFAWMTLPSGREVSLVDVPGHERFIKNMLAGAGGIDLALLVVAADEGVMPQTREHLAILDLLGIERGLLVVTKKDLVEEDFLELVSADVLEAVEGTTLEGSPIVACSGKTGDGLDELKRVLDEQLQATTPKPDIGRPRLPVDRSFTVAGFGTVVTGTLLDGSFEVGQEVELLPGGTRARIRGLQHHKEQVERAQPGRRTAVNLSGVSKEEVRRGQVLVLPGLITPTDAVDTQLRAVALAKRALKHGAELTMHTGSAEVACRLLLLDRQELAPGDEGWAQLRLAGPIAVVKGDRFVLRTPNDTVAGGQIVDAHPPRHRRFHDATLAALESRAGDDPLIAVLRQNEPATLKALLAEMGGSQEELDATIKTLTDAGDVVALGADATLALITAAGFAELTSRAHTAIEAFHSEHPLRKGMPREELRSRLKLEERTFAGALERWSADEAISESGASVSRPGWTPTLTPEQESAAEAYVATLAAKPYAPPTDAQPPTDVLDYLRDAGRVITLGGITFTNEAYEEMVRSVTEHLRSEGTVTLAQVRDMFGTSRKYAQALLEHLDQERVTRRVGDERVLRGG